MQLNIIFLYPQAQSKLLAKNLLNMNLVNDDDALLNNVMLANFSCIDDNSNIYIQLASAFISTVPIRSVWSKPKAGEWWEKIVPMMDDNEFKEHFRVHRRTFNYLCTKLKPCLEKMDTNMRAGTPVDKRVGMGLHYLASNEELRVVQALFGAGKTTAWEAIEDFINAVIQILEPEFVKFPHNAQELKTASDEFETLLGYPMCIGDMDGSHIPICSPKDLATNYVCYKSFTSMVLFAVCDARYRFTYLNVGSPGRNGDSFILQGSSLYEILQSNFLDSVTRQMGDVTVPLCIMGDSAFPLRRHIMKPFAEYKGLNEIESYFNRKFCAARRVIENAFGRTKARWRIMYKKMEGSIDKMTRIIRACCILNNVCEYFNDTTVNEWICAARQAEENAASNRHKKRVCVDGDNGPGKDLRLAIARYLYDKR